MASIRFRDGKWNVQVRKRGHSESKTFISKTDARAWALQIEASLEASGHDKYHRGRGKTLSDALDEYGRRVTPTKASKIWETRRIKYLKGEHIASIPLADIDTPDLAEWVEERLKTVKSSTVNRDLNLLSNVFSKCVSQWRWMKFNPARELDRPQDPPPRERRISDEEKKRILFVLGYDSGVPETPRELTGLYFLIALETAMRLGEIHSISEETFLPDLQCVRLLNDKSAKLSKSRGRTYRDVAISKKAVELIKLLLQCDIVTKPHNVSKLFENAVTLAGIDNLTFHDSRHEACTRLAAKVEVMQLAKITGHRDLRYLLNVYYNPTTLELASQLD